MAKYKYRSNVAELHEEKNSDAIIDSGATHHFFHSRSTDLEIVKEEPVKAAAGTTTIVGRGTVQLPIGLIVQALHAPMFSSNILAVRLLSKTFEILFSSTIRGYEACFFIKQGTLDVLHEFRAHDGLYPMSMKQIEGQGTRFALNAKKKATNDDVEEWHRKLGHIHPDRYFKLSEYTNDVPKFDRELLKKHQCVPCITAKLRRATIPSSTRKTTRPLELVHFDILDLWKNHSKVTCTLKRSWTTTPQSQTSSY